MLPDFGCGIHDLVVRAEHAGARSRQSCDAVRTALVHVRAAHRRARRRRRERRASNLLLIRINYRIRANNAIGNLVYPFYIREAA